MDEAVELVAYELFFKGSVENALFWLLDKS